MTAVDTPLINLTTRCGSCGQEDDHPKHQIAVGFNNQHTNGLFHEHDFPEWTKLEDGATVLRQNGVIYYHFDCPTPWHDLYGNLATRPFPSPDPKNAPWMEWKEESAALHRKVAEVHQAIIEKSRNAKGDKLRSWINKLNPRGGAGGIDQVIATATLDAWAPNSGTTTVGVKTITGPLSLRILTVIGTDASAGTEQGTSAGYTAGGSPLAFAAAATASKSTNAAVSWTNMPACSTPGSEQWDNSATKQRIIWAPWAAGTISIASGNTFTVASGNVTNQLQ